MRWTSLSLFLGLGAGVLGAVDISSASDLQQCRATKPDKGQSYEICERLQGNLSFTPREGGRALLQLRRIAQRGGESLQQCETRTLEWKLRLEICERVEQDPAASPRERARALLQIGRLVQWTSGGVDKAIGAWEKAMATDPSFVPPIVARAEWLVLSQQGHEAIKLLQPVLAADPHDLDALVMIGRAYVSVRAYGQALRSFDAALKLDPLHVRALYQAGKLFEMNGSYREAAMLYERAGEKYDPTVPSETGHGIPNPYQAAARNYEYLGDITKALPLMTRVIDKDPSAAVDPRALEQRASYYETLGYNSEAISDLTTALRHALPEEFPQLLFKRGVLYQKSGKPEAATEDFRKALDAGDRKSILRMQVYLRNQGFTEIEIDGTASPDLFKSVSACLLKAKCGSGLGKPI